MNESLKYCQICNNFIEKTGCIICHSTWRKRSQLCVVENVSNILKVEKMFSFTGFYHVLHGSLSPSSGIGPDDLFLSNLFPRLLVENNKGIQIQQIILAVQQTYESQMTANYVEKLVKPLNIQISRFEIEKSYDLKSEIVQ